MINALSGHLVGNGGLAVTIVALSAPPSPIAETLAIVSGLVGLFGYSLFSWNQYKKARHHAKQKKSPDE